MTEAAPTVGSFGPAGGMYSVTPTTPFVFAGVTDASPSDAAAGFTYYTSVDGGACTESSSPLSAPLSNVTPPSGMTLIATHTVSGYVVDSEGQQSAVVTTSVDMTPAGSRRQPSKRSNAFATTS